MTAISEKLLKCYNVSLFVATFYFMNQKMNGFFFCPQKPDQETKSNLFV